MNYDNGYRYYVLEYVLDRWIPISMHQTYHGALANVTAERQVIRYLDKMVTKCGTEPSRLKFLIERNLATSKEGSDE
tara:strand:+ start:382 stop:612 length:231 start_codon:yes stop_codon:yes gene_type:complete